MKIMSHLAPKIDFEIWKCHIFDGLSSNSLKRYKQILSGYSFVTKNLLNFAWLSMKFHNRGHINDQYLRKGLEPESADTPISSHLIYPLNSRGRGQIIGKISDFLGPGGRKWPPC